VNKLVLKLLLSKYERESCNAGITKKNDVTLAAGLIALLFNPEARAQESPAQKTAGKPSS
jgi:hypothetical protein